MQVMHHLCSIKTIPWKHNSAFLG